MIILSLIFLFFIGMNIILNSMRVKRVDAYLTDMEKELTEKLKILK